MKLHLPLSLRSALLAALAVFGSAYAGVVGDNYAVQDYLDIAANAGQYSAGAQNVTVYKADGSVGGTLALIPSMSSFMNMGNGGAGLVLPQYAMSASHCKLPGSGTANTFYFSTNHEVNYYGNTGGGSYVNDATTGAFVDTEIYRLSKIVTEATYAPMCTDRELMSQLGNLEVYRLGTGKSSVATDAGKIQLNINGRPHGGTVNVVSSMDKGADSWFVAGQLEKDAKDPLSIGDDSGDSGSPVFVFNEKTRQFETVAAASTGTNISWGNYYTSTINPTAALAIVASLTDAPITADGRDGKVLWNVQGDADHGTLTQGGNEWQYHGKTSSNALSATKDLIFAAPSADTVSVELQGNINNGAGSVTFKEGHYSISSAAGGDYTLNSAGFITERGAWLTTDYTGKAGDDWRKVGEGVWTIAGQGDNMVNLNVGGGVVRFDNDLNIIREGEVRLNRTGGVAADKVTLSAGIGSVVIMSDTKQFNSFAFGVGGGILNINGHNQSWDAISHIDSGATIANLTALGESRPQDATFTYTGNGIFKGSFADEGAEGAKLKVVYDKAGSEWVLAGQSHNAGGYVVQNGTLALQGINTEHVAATDRDDWVYAVLETPSVIVKDGAAFRMGHHALATTDITVEGSGQFILNSTVNKAQESVHGSNRQDVTDFTALRGNVVLQDAASSMTADTSSAVQTTMQGNITGAGTLTKSGSGDLYVDGRVNLSGGTISAGSLVVGDKTGFGGTWTIGADGTFGVKGMTGDMLAHIAADSTGVLALGADSATELNLSGHKGLTIGALGEVQYGTADKTLTAQDGAWRLGGGGGNLFVNFKLAGENDLIIGTEASGGMVTLTNNANTLSGNIIIKGSGNFLRYNDIAALGSARVALNYGNSMVLSDPTVLSIMSADSAGVMELNGDSAAALNLSANKLALGAEGTVRYTGTLSANKDGAHRFGGSGTLVVDSALSGSRVEVDGQGQTGGTVVLAQQYNGTVTAGGGLHLDTPNESGSIRLQTENNALANAAAVNLQKGATLDAAGSQQTVGNVTAESGAVITNSSAEAATLTLNNTANTSLASGALQTTAGALNIVKTGAGTLALGNNNDAWQGTFTINEGTVTGRLNDQYSSSFGTNRENTIIINEGGTLRLSAGETYSKRLDLTRLTQEVVGTGTLEISSGSTGVFLHQTKAFDGTVKLVDNTRMTIGNFSSNGFGYTNNTALANATIVVEAGSQARVTNQADNASPTNVIHNYSNYVISGSSFAGKTYVVEYLFGFIPNEVSRPQDRCTGGALSVDCGTVLHGNVTLATDSSIASWSSMGAGVANDYGQAGYVGGTLLGTISGEGKVLTKVGNERISLRADAANSFGDFIISGSSGSEGVAVRLEQGAAVDTHSTALGKGNVTLGGGLTLEFANAGTAGNSVTYTYDNAISAGNNATLRSTHDNTVLNGSVAMTGDTLNLATQNGSTLRLEQGVRGNGTLSIADGSDVALGGTTAGQFQGSIAAGAGSTVTLLSGKAAGSGVSMSFTDSLNLHIANGGDFRLDALTGSGDAPTLNLTYDAIGANGLGHLDVGSLTASSANLTLDFTHASGITAGTYTLFSGIGSDFTVNCSGETGVDYMNAAFTRDGSGAVLVTLSLNGGNGIWHGTEADHNWNGSHFGAAVETAVFNDTAAKREVRVTENVSMNKALIHTQEGYIFTADGGKATIGTLTQVADGTTVLGAGAATITDAVVNGGCLVVQDSTTLTGTVSGSGTLAADFGAGSGTITADMTGLNTLEVQSGRYESTGSVGANALVVKDGGQYYANGGTHATAMQVEGSGRTADNAALQLNNGANVSGSVTAVADAAIGVDSNATGTLSGNLNAAADTTVTKTGAGTLMLNANNSSTLNGKLVIADGTVKIGNDLALGSTAVAGRVVIAEGGTLDINGWGGAAQNYHAEMNGGTLTNTGNNVDTGKRQVVSSMTLTADSTVHNTNGHEFGLIGSGYAATALNLQGNVLEKTGDGIYHLVRTTITGGDGGKLKVSGGTLDFDSGSKGAAGSLQADIEMAGGALNGTIHLGDDVTLAVTKASTLGVNVQTNGHTLTFDTAVAASYANTISGNGALVKTGAAELTFAEAAVISGNDLSVQQGTVTVRRNATDGKSFGTVQLANGTTLKQFNTNQPTSFNEVDTLTVGGSATLQEDNHAGAWKVKSLQLAEGTTSATLNLTSSSSSSVASVFELGDEETDGGNFAGEMVLKSTNSDYARSAVLQISNGEIADHAVINMASTGANNANQALGLGINAERVTIAGLESGNDLGNRAKVFSGSVSPNTNAPAFTGDDTTRTLAIDTAAGTDAHFRGMVGKNLHIEKSGEGKQTLSGASSAFNGTISVAGGTLLLKDAALEMLNGGADVELRGGVLSLNDSLTLSATDGKAALLQGGSVQTSLEQGTLSAGISGIKLNHAKMDIAAGTSLVLEDVLFASTSQLSGAGNRVEANRVTLVADAGGNAVLMPAPQPMAARALASLPQPVAGMLVLTNITDITLGGSDIFVDISSFDAEELQQYDTLAIALGDDASFAVDANVLVTYAGNEATATYRDGMGYLNNLRELVTPEPTTATLSLLALTALAARRRRRS